MTIICRTVGAKTVVRKESFNHKSSSFFILKNSFSSDMRAGCARSDSDIARSAALTDVHVSYVYQRVFLCRNVWPAGERFQPFKVDIVIFTAATGFARRRFIRSEHDLINNWARYSRNSVIDSLVIPNTGVHVVLKDAEAFHDFKQRSLVDFHLTFDRF